MKSRTHASSFGTTGGFLVDQFDGRTFAVTAQHVSDGAVGIARATPDWAISGGLRRLVDKLLGTTNFGRYCGEACPMHWDSPAVRVAPASCTAQTSPMLVGLDVALHDALADPRRRQIQSANIADLSQVLDLSFHGATSGRQRVQVTSYSVWHSYRLGTQTVCVHDCVQVKRAGPRYVRQSVSRAGDSGAWLVAQDRGWTHWTGLLLRGDGDVAGFVPAERVLDAVRSDLG